LIAATDILGSHHFERYPEYRQVGGVSADLSVWDDEVEAKARTSQSSGTSLTWLDAVVSGWAQPGAGLRLWWSGREPRTQRAPGQGQGLAEPLLGETRYLGMEAEPGSDQQGTQRWPPQVDLSEHGRGHGEQRSHQGDLVVLGGLLRGASPAAAKLERCLPGGLDTGAEPADALGIEALGTGGLGHPDGEPPRSNAVNQGRGNDNEQGAWRSGGSVQSNEWG
jgi:hypothetical protein